MTLNTKRKKEQDGFECQTKKKKNSDSKCQIEDATLNAKRKKDMMALNAELETHNGPERQIENAALNIELKEHGGFECQTGDTALNA